MNRYMRMYLYGVLGAIGGLFGWQASNVLGLSFMDNLYIAEAVVGAILGGIIGFTIGLGEGFSTQNVLFGLRKSLLSLILGAVGGAIALPLAEWLFLALGGQTWARPVGWAIFGTLTGLATGITGGGQVWKGGLGGFLGGLLGGALLEVSRLTFANTLVGKGIGLTLLGACTGIFIALIVFALSRAWFEVEEGKMRGVEFILDKFLKKDSQSAFIGSSALKADIVIMDPKIAPQHAMLQGHGDHFSLKDMSMEGTYADGKRIEEIKLRSGQRIKMGGTTLVYREKRLS